MNIVKTFNIFKQLTEKNKLLQNVLMVISLITSLTFTVFSLSSLFFITGCANFPPGIHRMDVQQGNDIKPEMIKKLRVGMSREAVKEILGSPSLVHMLDNERWDYYYSFLPGRKGPKAKVEQHFTLFFKHD